MGTKKNNKNLIEKLKQDHDFSEILSKLIISRKFNNDEINTIDNDLKLNNVFLKNEDFEKSIELAEPLGTETQLFFKLNDKEIISRMYNPRSIQVGEKIKFEIDLTKVHFFDHETEKTI